MYFSVQINHYIMQVYFSDMSRHLQLDIAERLLDEHNWLSGIDCLDLEDIIHYHPDSYFNFFRSENGVDIFLKP